MNMIFLRTNKARNTSNKGSFSHHFENKFLILGHGKHKKSPRKGHGKSWNFIRSKQYEPYNPQFLMCAFLLYFLSPAISFESVQSFIEGGDEPVPKLPDRLVGVKRCAVLSVLIPTICHCARMS